jgi:hypothetical protein
MPEEFALHRLGNLEEDINCRCLFCRGYGGYNIFDEDGRIDDTVCERVVSIHEIDSHDENRWILFIYFDTDVDMVLPISLSGLTPNEVVKQITSNCGKFVEMIFRHINESYEELQPIKKAIKYRQGMNKEEFYVTTFCNFAHRLSDGKPIEHECYIIPPKLLRTEMEDSEDAKELWREWSLLRNRIIHRGVKKK